MKFQAATATERSLYANQLAAERAQRARDLEARRVAGTVRSASANRKRRRHGR